MNINRKQILETLLRVIDHISDKDYQIRIWIRGEGPEWDDFTETVCHFFEEGSPILKNYKKFGITKGQYQLLKKFYRKFEDFSDENDFPEDFIDTPEWEKIMNLAQEVLEAFNYQKK